MSFGCRVTGADVCLLVRLKDGRIVHLPGTSELVTASRDTAGGATVPE